MCGSLFCDRAGTTEYKRRLYLIETITFRLSSPEDFTIPIVAPLQYGKQLEAKDAIIGKMQSEKDAALADKDAALAAALAATHAGMTAALAAALAATQADKDAALAAQADKYAALADKYAALAAAQAAKDAALAAALAALADKDAALAASEQKRKKSEEELKAMQRAFDALTKIPHFRKLFSESEQRTQQRIARTLSEAVATVTAGFKDSIGLDVMAVVTRVLQRGASLDAALEASSGVEVR